MKTLKKIVLSVIFTMICTFNVMANDYNINPNSNCLFINQGENIPQKGVKVPLNINTSYEVSINGDAFFSDQKGSEADPMPGVVIFYSRNAEDGFDTEYTVLRKGEKLNFKTPGSEPESVFLIAFVMDYWPGIKNTGSYTLRVLEK